MESMFKIDARYIPRVKYVSSVRNQKPHQEHPSWEKRRKHGTHKPPKPSWNAGILNGGILI